MQMITRFSTYQHVNRDRLFFEGIYIVAINLCDDAFAALRRRPDIEARSRRSLHACTWCPGLHAVKLHCMLS